MKSVGGLFDRIAALENLHAAMNRAARGKRSRGPVARFLADPERQLATLRVELIAGVYRPRPLEQFRIFDPKPRLISCADFRDRVVHHALCAHVAPVIERRLIADNYACRTGLGSHRAVLRAGEFARSFGFWLRTDIRHYYETIDHDILLEQLRCLFREPALRHLLEIVVRQPLAGCAPGKGLPIGSLTSQWFANLYLDGVDHWLKEERRLPGYVRYMDDLALWSNSKDFLFAVANDLEERVRAKLKVELKREATLLAPTSEGMPFLGYRIFPSLIREKAARVRRRHRLLRQREAQWESGEISEIQLQASARSMDGPRRFLGFGQPLVMPARTAGPRAGAGDEATFDLGRRSRGSNRVNRGGSWRNDDASNFRGANRDRNDPGNRNDNQGFRLASTLPNINMKLSNPPTPVSRSAGTETTDASAASKPAAQSGGGVIFVQLSWDWS
jgi:hypothetical protein